MKYDYKERFWFIIVNVPISNNVRATVCARTVDIDSNKLSDNTGQKPKTKDSKI
jgi:hypothetical protein